MNGYAKQLMNSPARTLVIFVLICAVGVYLLPWLINPAISMTLGGWDLAEWASLHPAVRFGDPNLTIPLHLRLVPALLIVIIALNVAKPRFSRRWWFGLLIVAVGAAALAPPPEFLNNTGDVNYRQQLMLTAATLIMGLVALSGILNFIRMPLTLILSALGIVATISGLQGAYDLMRGLNTTPSPGLGGLLIVVLFALVIAVEVFWTIKSNGETR